MGLGLLSVPGRYRRASSRGATWQDHTPGILGAAGPGSLSHNIPAVPGHADSSLPQQEGQACQFSAPVAAFNVAPPPDLQGFWTRMGGNNTGSRELDPCSSLRQRWEVSCPANRRRSERWQNQRSQFLHSQLCDPQATLLDYLNFNVLIFKMRIIMPLSRGLLLVLKPLAQRPAQSKRSIDGPASPFCSFKKEGRLTGLFLRCLALRQGLKMTGE